LLLLLSFDLSDLTGRPFTAQFIPGLTSFSFGSWRPVVQAANSPSVKEAAGVPASITPDTIYKTYQVRCLSQCAEVSLVTLPFVPTPVSQTPTGGSHGSMLGSQAVIEYGSLANFNTADLQTFFKQLNPDQVGETCGVAYGDNDGDIRGSVEANLDVQYIMAVGRFVNTTTYKIAEPTVGIEDQMLDYTYIVGNQVRACVLVLLCTSLTDPSFNLPLFSTAFSPDRSPARAQHQLRRVWRRLRQRHRPALQLRAAEDGGARHHRGPGLRRQRRRLRRQGLHPGVRLPLLPLHHHG
jgi:hypothetical protein